MSRNGCLLNGEQGGPRAVARAWTTLARSKGIAERTPARDYQGRRHDYRAVAINTIRAQCRFFAVTRLTLGDAGQLTRVPVSLLRFYRGSPGLSTAGNVIPKVSSRQRLQC